MNTKQLSEVSDFINKLSNDDGAKVLAQLQSLENGWTEALVIKPLKGKIKELIVGQYRIVFFDHRGTIYAIDAFRKKSQKTPKRIIEKAIRTHNIIIKITNETKTGKQKNK